MDKEGVDRSLTLLREDARVTRDLRLYYTNVSPEVLANKRINNQLISEKLKELHMGVYAKKKTHLPDGTHGALALQWAEDECLIKNLKVANSQDVKRCVFEYGPSVHRLHFGMNTQVSV